MSARYEITTAYESCSCAETRQFIREDDICVYDNETDQHFHKDSAKYKEAVVMRKAQEDKHFDEACRFVGL